MWIAHQRTVHRGPRPARLRGPGQKAFLDPAWVSAGPFISAIDSGRSWLPGFERFGRLATDDRPQAAAQHAGGRLAHAGPYDTEIAELVARLRLGCEHSEDRVVLIHPGNIVGVLGISVLIRDLAMSRRLGQAIME